MKQEQRNDAAAAASNWVEKSGGRAVGKIAPLIGGKVGFVCKPACDSMAAVRHSRRTYTVEPPPTSMRREVEKKRKTLLKARERSQLRPLVATTRAIAEAPVSEAATKCCGSCMPLSFSFHPPPFSHLPLFFRILSLSSPFKRWYHIGNTFGIGVGS